MICPPLCAPGSSRVLYSLVCLAFCTTTVAVAAESGNPRVRSYAMPREIKDVSPSVVPAPPLQMADVEALPPVPSPAATQAAKQSEELPLDRDLLFGTVDSELFESETDGNAGVAATANGKPTWNPFPLRGFVDFAPAYAYESPGHWSRGVVRTQVEAKGVLGSAKWKASVRLDADPVYFATDFYPKEVREDQRLELLIRETYVDLALPSNWELRLGRQHVIWGEAVSLFFADVVSARDLRDYILPEFEIMRIPQWAARAEYFGERLHFEVLWIPFPSYDNIGKPGAEFYPYRPEDVPGFETVLRGDQRPANTLSNTNYGVRVSGLVGGWDLSGFYYRSNSVAATLYREVIDAPTPSIVYEPRHDRIWQVGGTVAKDLGSVVLKSEAVYTHGRHFEVTDPSSADGAVQQNTLDYLVGLDFILPLDGRLNLQGFQRVYFGHDEDILFDQFETGFSVLVSAKVLPKLEPQLLYIQSLNSNDRLLRPRINWYARPNLRISAGVDIFAGPDTGAFGTFDDSDRVYAEARYTF